MANFLMVPGLNNSDANHWQSLWEARLHSVSRVEQLHWERAELDVWADQVAAQIKKTKARWVIAHSFGCLATVRALSRENLQVEGIFLVAPADPDKFAVRHLLPSSGLSVPATIVGSLTDPWFSWEKVEFLAKQWQTPLYCAGDAGHINSQSGHGQWTEGWVLFERFRDGLLKAA